MNAHIQCKTTDVMNKLMPVYMTFLIIPQQSANWKIGQNKMKFKYQITNNLS